MVNVAIFGVLAIVVLGLVGGAYLTSKNSKDQLTPSADAAMPAGVLPASDEYRYGVVAGGCARASRCWRSGRTSSAPPARHFEATFGPTIEGDWPTPVEAQVIFRSTVVPGRELPRR